ncbi:hypothetical protein D7M15_01405 [Streptomyces sp. Z26]|nr:hypothetical protein D7M15_01405 [Streptomyces sp. Z26]
MAREHVARLQQLFVWPPGLRRAHVMLRDSGTVLLAGQPGSGRRTAAMMLLSSIFHDSNDFHELPPDEDDPATLSELVGKGDRLLLDLSLGAGEQRTGFEAKLRTLLPLVGKRGACLVVVLPQLRGRRSHDEFSPYTVDVGRPSETAVLWRYLRLAEIHPSRTDMSEGRLQRFLDSAPGMGELSYFAHLAVSARDRSRGANEFPAWRDEALAAFFDRSDQVAKDIGSRDGGQRALSLSVSMLPRSPPDEIFTVNTELLKVLRQPLDERPRLDHADLRQQLSDVRAGTDQHGLVQFDLLAYDAAVRTHFWTYYPDLRPKFRDWVRDCVQRKELSRAARSGLIGLYAEQSLRTACHSDLLALVREWTAVGGPDHLADEATLALSLGVEHEQYGAWFRREIRELAREPDLPGGLGRVFVRVCSEVVSLRHPDQALVRLHHLARQRRDTVAENARAALLQLVNTDDRLWRRLLRRCSLDLPRTRQSRDVALFLDLATPSRLASRQGAGRPLIADPEVRAQLGACWFVVLRRHTHTAWESHVRSWLSGAREHPHHREDLLDVLLNACSGEGRVLSRLHLISRDWAAGQARAGHHASCTPVSESLDRRIRTALGIRLPPVRSV